MVGGERRALPGCNSQLWSPAPKCAVKGLFFFCLRSLGPVGRLSDVLNSLSWTVQTPCVPGNLSKRCYVEGPPSPQVGMWLRCHLSDTQAPQKLGLQTIVSPFWEMWEETGDAELSHSSSVFALLKCLYSITTHIHVEKRALHRVRVLSCNFMMNLIKISECELCRR